MAVPRPKRNVIIVGDGKPFYLTAQALRELEAKRDRLTKAIPVMATETGRTAAYGDRSENFEYSQAKGALSRTKIQLMIVENQLKNAVVIQSGPSATGTVQLGSTVILEASGKEPRTFQILGPHEADPAHGKISNLSPLGAALMNKKAGDTVTVQIGEKTQTYTIQSVT